MIAWLSCLHLSRLSYNYFSTVFLSKKAIVVKELPVTKWLNGEKEDGISLICALLLYGSSILADHSFFGEFSKCPLNYIIFARYCMVIEDLHNTEGKLIFFSFNPQFAFLFCNVVKPASTMSSLIIQCSSSTCESHDDHDGHNKLLRYLLNNKVPFYLLYANTLLFFGYNAK